jgi:hypothetical protein
MTYVLVHLCGDRATTDAGRLVEHIKVARTAIAVLAGDSPSHPDIIAALTTEDGTSGVCIGHGRAEGLGPDLFCIWANAAQLGEMFRDRRLYAYACDTAGHSASLGARAVEAGVAVFVGHEGRIEAPLPSEEYRLVVEVAGAAMLAFIDGHDDELTLRHAVHDAGDAFFGDEPVVPCSSAGRDASNFWRQSEIFDQLAFSLRVHRRDPERT